MSPFTTPIIYIFFNRPDVTRITFARIRAVRPTRLYLIADGPRAHKPNEAAICAETRSIVESMLDWPCQVIRDYSEKNLGCGRRLSSGLTSAFALLGEAIVLEDDILPHPSLFQFCAEQLALHRDNPRIHEISCFNPLARYGSASGAVVPSLFNWMWGWASWQRAWKDYQYDISSDWNDSTSREQIRAYIDNDLNYNWHARNFDELLSGKVNTWDFQWSHCLLRQRRLTLASSVNLIENLGFNGDATHTTTDMPYLRGLKSYQASNAPTKTAFTTHDALHDKLHGQILMEGSQKKIALLRLLARWPSLAAKILKTTQK